MSRTHILIVHTSSSEIDRLSRLASRFRPVVAWTRLPEPGGARERIHAAVAVIEADQARYASLRDVFGPDTSVILTGPDEEALRAAVQDWPPEFYVDALVNAPSPARDRFFVRALERALEQSRLRGEADELRRSLAEQESKVRDVYAEIQEIKGLVNANFILEMEKRLAIETKYVWFQKERQRIESILRKIYAADDVSSLLDIVPDIRDVVKASSASVYIIEQTEALGRYLKPVVWDNAYLSHADFSRFIAAWDAQDFASTAARYGQGINASDLTFDRRLTRRYVESLRAPLRSLLAVPIMHDRKVIGVVEVYNKMAQGKPGPESFTRDDQQILQGISEHMAIAMMKLNLIQYDALTGLLRPEPFFEKVLQQANALGKRRREEGGRALVMGDVDWFKAYNDRNGHEAGNRLLRELAHVLKLSIREEDLLCRYGGEEFLFFLAGVKGLDEATVLTDRIRKNVEDHYFESQEFQPQNNLTMSFGVTVFPPHEPDRALTREDLKKLAAEADQALAEAKGKWRPGLGAPTEGKAEPSLKNRVCTFAGERGDERRAEEARPGPERPPLERRRQERVNASTLMMIRDNGAFKVAKTVNLSLGGARIVSDVELVPARTLDTILVLGDKASVLKSEVVYSERPANDAAFFYAGLKFRDLTFKDLKGIEDWLLRFRKKVVSAS
jgi:diguanylate cyclase (GGDEF)-like protein